MSFAIAAAGTGGHVYPGLAVGEALVASGVPHEEVLYIGGDRLERSVYPERGFPFLEVEMRGLERSLSARNLELPSLVRRASRAIQRELSDRGVRAVLGMGGYVTLPAAWAARRLRVRIVRCRAERPSRARQPDRLTPSGEGVRLLPRDGRPWRRRGSGEPGEARTGRVRQG